VQVTEAASYTNNTYWSAPFLWTSRQGKMHFLGPGGHLGVEDLAHRADARLAQVRHQSGQEAPGAGAVVGVDAQPGVEERADQPGPHRPLVVGRIACPQVAVVGPLVVGIPRRQGPQPDRRHEPLAYDAQQATQATRVAEFYRALSLFRQGKTDEARNLATEAAAKMRPLPDDAKNPLAAGGDHLILWLVYKEAKATIKFDAAPPEKQ
jgi:hypothetical protein